MPDYIYLLENRLSKDQQLALRQIAEAARAASMNVFLTGGAVRDLTSGSSVRDLDIAVQGNALKLKKALAKTGATLWGEHEPSHTLFYRFPASVRVEVSSTRQEEYPKPGKPVYHWSNILEDLRRRDFTANAMALSLNEGSYGLLMDPLNGVADIEARLLRLVSNYGFLEDPSRLLRVTRFTTRLGWEMDERTRSRYESSKEENAIEAISSYQRGYELEEIGHEEDALDALNALEREGWMRPVFPSWTHSRADIASLGELRSLLTQLQTQGVNPDPSAAFMQLLTAKLSPKDLTALKRAFVRPGFVEEWDNLDSSAKEFAKQLTSKDAAAPSATWKLLTTANPQAVLWLSLTSKAAPIQSKYKNFFTVWPSARQKIPYLLMQEMRITPDLPRYQEMLDQLFFSTIDGKLESEEQLRAFLEPYSPPAPPPPVTVRRSRGSRKSGEAKGKARGEAADAARETKEAEASPLPGNGAAAVEGKKGKPAEEAAQAVKTPSARASREPAATSRKGAAVPAAGSSKKPGLAKPAASGTPKERNAPAAKHAGKPLTKAANHSSKKQAGGKASGAKPAKKPAASKDSAPPKKAQSPHKR